MRIKIKNIFFFQLNKYPFVKNILLRLLGFYYDNLPIIVGKIIRFPVYVKNIFNTKVIGYPGNFGFSGGVYNPGALAMDEDKILLLAKAQNVPWYEARGNKNQDYMKGSPVVFILNKKTLETVDSLVINSILGFPTDKDYAIEDLRLFNWQGRKMINHSLITLQTEKENSNQVRVCSVLSELDEQAKLLKFCSIPRLDFTLQEIEKNWIYKEFDNNLLLFYSINPYKVLILKDKSSFTFETKIDVKLNSKISDPGGFGTMVSYSTNPIDYDEMNWLVVIHQIDHKYTGRCYYHWVVLINKSTLIPVKITSKPIFSGLGARGKLTGIRYISSVLKIDNEIVFFAGEGDIYVTVTKKAINEIQTLFVEI